MSEYKLTREEMQTTINGNAATQTWDICTADPRVIRRLEKMGYKPYSRKNPSGFVSYTIPFDRIKVLRPEKRKLSDRQRENITKARSARKALTLNNEISGQDSPAMVR